MWVTHPVPENLEKYYQSDDYISHTDSRNTFFDRIYQGTKTFRLKRKVRMLEKLLGGRGKLLDIGAGTGDLVKQAISMGWQAEGVEPNATAREKAQQKGIALKENGKAFPKKAFDVITLWHVLEHLPELEDSIQQIGTLLKPNGILIVAVPNFKSWDAKYYKEYWAGYDAPRHLWHFSKDALKAIFSKNNFQLNKIYPMQLDAFYVALLSEKYKHGRMRWLTAGYVGLMSNLKAWRSGEYSSLIYVLKKAPE
ncbi:MAG: class I SAM-dependent methyltransferase [Eudoraea sp.]|nr:class I SAM-dependent methyltransferase [Eudoraea sp.]